MGRAEVDHRGRPEGVGFSGHRLQGKHHAPPPGAFGRSVDVRVLEFVCDLAQRHNALFQPLAAPRSARGALQPSRGRLDVSRRGAEAPGEAQRRLGGRASVLDHIGDPLGQGSDDQQHQDPRQAPLS